MSTKNIFFNSTVEPSGRGLLLLFIFFSAEPASGHVIEPSKDSDTLVVSTGAHYVTATYFHIFSG